MRITFHSILIVVILALCSCGSDDQPTKANKAYVLKETGEYRFQLDSSLALSSSKVTFYKKEDGNPQLLIFNTFNNTLYEYSFGDSIVKNRIAFQAEGPEGLGSTAFGLNFIRKSDNEYIFLNCAEASLSVFDSSAHLTKKIDLSRYRKENIYFNKNFPLSIIDNTVIIPTHTNDYGIRDMGKQRVVVQCNIGTGESSTLITLPAKHQNSTMGTGEEFLLSTAIFRGKVVVNLPRVEEVYWIDLSNQEIRPVTEAESENFGEIPPFSEVRLETGALQAQLEKLKEYARVTPSYHSVLSNNDDSVLFRISLLPIPLEEFRNEKTINRKFTIVMLDKNFQRIGEQEIGSTADYNLGNSFCINSSLFLLNKKNYDEDDNFFTFHRFELFPK